MSIPNPINVSPSTTQVQINPLESPYTSVLLNQIQYPGQLISILDGTSSFGVLTTPIVVSTAITNSFMDGSVSTLINQPQGFITAQTINTNTWAFLNSFPFRNQYLSAGLLNLTTSTLFTALTSTLFENVSSMTVENLRVTGNFVQSQGITLNTNISSLGTVELLSSLTVWRDVYLSSGMSTFGEVTLFSSLNIESHLTTPSSILTQSSMYISSSLIALGVLSTPSIEFQDGLVGTTLNVSTSQITFANIAGSLLIHDSISTNSTVSMGGFLTASYVKAESAIFLSSAALFQRAEINSSVSTLQNVSTTGSLGVGGRLTVGLDLTVEDSIYVNGNATVNDFLTIQSTLIANEMHVGTLLVSDNYTNGSTITSVNSVTIDSNIGLGSLSSASTFISGFLTIYQDFGSGPLLLNSYLNSLNSISSLGSVSSGQDFLLEGSLSSFGITQVSSMSTLGETFVMNSTITSRLGESTIVDGNLLGLGDLNCTGTLTISSIQFLSSLVANNVVTERANVGTYGIFNQMNIVTYTASSITFGYIENSPYTFDLSGSLSMNTTVAPAIPISTNLVSTALYNVPKIAESYIRVGTDMAVNASLESNSLISQPLGYFLSSPVTVESTLSTLYVLADSIEGVFIGDGSQLSNFQYPSQISVATLLIDGKLFMNNLEPPIMITASTLKVQEATIGTAFVKSTINIGSLEIRGNQGAFEFDTERNTIQTSIAVPNVLLVNDVQISGDATGSVARRVTINQASYTTALNVYSTLAVDGIYSVADTFQLELKSFQAEKILTDTMEPFDDVGSGQPIAGHIYLSSGTISTVAGPFFLGEHQLYDQRYNIVQPLGTTLQFNSTLFIERSGNLVGVNTKPNFTLDAPSIYGNTTTTPSNALTVRNVVNLVPNLSTLSFAFVNQNATYSNTLVTSDVNVDPFVNFFFFNQTEIYRAGFSPGLSRLSNILTSTYEASEKNLPQFLLGSQLVGNGQISGLITLLVPFMGAYNTNLAYYNIDPPDTFRAMATDGYRYVACGTIAPENQYSYYSNTLFVSNNNYLSWEFNAINSAIFPSWTPPTSYTRGGHDIVYGGMNAPIWITVGAGSDGSIWRSTDATNWSVVNIGQFELYSIVSTELPYNGGTVFLTGGAYLFASGNTFIPLNGFVFASTDLGVNWTLTGSNFTGPVKQVATNGSIVVAAVNATTPGATLWYSYLTSSNTYNWSNSTGDVFTTRANSVIWTGSNFIAGGDTGIRVSVDGIFWQNPNPLPVEVNNLAFTSNAATMIRFTNLFEPEKRLLFQDSPNLQCQRLVSAPTISYYSNALNLNNGCILDSAANIISFGSLNTPSPLQGTTFQSTFYATDGYVSSFLSTTSLTLGAYRLQIQSV